MGIVFVRSCLFLSILSRVCTVLCKAGLGRGVLLGERHVLTYIKQGLQ